MSEDNLDWLDSLDEVPGQTPDRKPIDNSVPEIEFDPEASGDDFVDTESDNNLDWLEKVPEVDEGYVPMVPKGSGITNDASTDPSYFTDVVLSAGVGVTNGIEETLDTIGQLTGETRFESLNYLLDPNNRIIPEWYKAETGVGVATEGIARFLGGFGVAGKVLKGVGWAAKADKVGEMKELSRLSSAGRSMTAGAMADFFVVDPMEGRLTDMLADIDSPYLDVVVFEYLESDDDDSVLEGRLKNVLEGMLLGGLIEGLMVGFRAMKAAKKNPEKAEEIYDKAAKEQEEISARLDAEDVVNDDELVLYHGSSKSIESLDPNRSLYLTDNPDYAKNYTDPNYSAAAKSKEDFNNLNPQVYKVVIKKDELFDTSIPEHRKIFDEFDKTSGNGTGLTSKNYPDWTDAENLREFLKDKGYKFKGAIVDEGGGGIDPSGIKIDDRGLSYVIYDNKAVKNFSELKPKVKSKIEKEHIVDSNPAIDTGKATKNFRSSEEAAKKDTENFLKDILNVDSFTSGRHVLKTIEDAVALFDDETLEYLSKDTLTNDSALELATLLSRNPEEVLASLPKGAEYAKQGTIRMLAAKMVIQRLSDQVGDLAKQVRALKKLHGVKTVILPGQKSYRHFPEDAKKIVEEYEKVTMILADSTYYLKEQIRNAARMTQAGRIKVGLAEGKLDIDRLVDDIESFKGDPLNMASKMSGNSPDQIVDAVSKSFSSKAVETFNSLYVNSLLSSPWTNLINITAGVYEALIRPLETAVGGIARGDTRTARLAFSQYMGMMQQYKDIWRMTKLSFNQGDAILDKKMQTIETKAKRSRSISAANYEMTPGTNAATAVDWVGSFLELPGRFLTTGDEFLKQANYRGRIHQSSVARMLDEGVEPGSEAWVKGLEDDMAKAFNPDGTAAVNRNPMAKEALQYSRESTFTNALKDGSRLKIGENLEKFFNSTPSLRFIAPFIRTPTNLWRHVVNRFPVLSHKNKQNATLWATGDPRARADVIGRQMFGAAAIGMGITYATSDVVISEKNGKQNTLPRITGSGPKNKTVRDLLLATGWQPYSILINEGTDKNPKWAYKQYNRTDPRFFYFGLIADMVEVGKLNPNEDGLADTSIALVQSIMNNLTDKTYTKGISDALELLEDPKGSTLIKYAGNIVNNTIPYSGMRRYATQELDPTGYEIRGVLDKFLETSGMTDSLEPKRDWKGDPIYKARTGFFFNDNLISSVTMSPSLIGRESPLKEDSEVIYKLAGLLKGYARIEKDSLHKDMDILEYKNDKGQSFLDAWRENVGKVRISGMKIEQFMKTKMQSSLYLNAGQGDPNDPGGKEQLMAKWYQAFKEKAKAELLKKGHLFKNDEGKKVSDSWKQSRKNKWRYYKEDAPHIKENKKKGINQLIGF